MFILEVDLKEVSNSQPRKHACGATNLLLSKLLGCCKHVIGASQFE